jgi:hypothetical protein
MVALSFCPDAVKRNLQFGGARYQSPARLAVVALPNHTAEAGPLFAAQALTESNHVAFEAATL